MSEEIKSTEAVVEEPSRIERCLTFGSGDLQLFVSTNYVIEIINGHSVTPLPLAPEYVKGVINLRGLVLPVVDLHACMGKGLAEFSQQTCIIIMDVDDILLGIVVDCVYQVTDINLDLLKPIPIKRQQRFLNGMVTTEDGTVLMSLDCQSLVHQ